MPIIRIVATPAMVRGVLHHILGVGLLLAFLFPADGNSQVTVTGSVTYVTSQSFYTDLGRKDGLAIGDTVRVAAEEQAVGRGIVTNLSTKSTVCSVLVNNGIAVGNKVTAQIQAGSEKPSIAEGGFTESAKPRKGKSKISGSLSIRSNQTDVTRDTLSSTLQRNYALVNLSYTNVLGLPLSLSLYARTRYSSETTSAGVRWYRMRLQYTLGEWNVTGGRVYLNGLGGAGALDGMTLSRKLGRFDLGLAGGLAPHETGSSDPKYGAYARYTNRQSMLRSFNFAVMQVDSGSVTHPYSVASLLFQPSEFISLNTNTTIDLPAGGQSSGLSAANLYLDFHWNQFIRGGVSLNYTANNSYYDNNISPLDSVYKNLTRTNGGARLSIRTSSTTSLTVLANLLNLENQSTPQQNYRLNFDEEDLLGRDIDLKFSLYHIGGVFYKETGGSAGAQLSFDNLDIYTGIKMDTYQYGIGGQQKTRKTLDVNLDYRFLRAFNAGLYAEYAVSSDEDLFYTSAQLSYRFRH